MAAPTARAELALAERRLNRRYPVHLPLQYKLLRYGRVVSTGEGRTVDLSSGGALLRCEVALPRGLQIELAISWPAKIDGRVGLTLLIAGSIVRVSGQSVAVSFSRYHFKTRTLRVPDSITEPAAEKAVRTMAKASVLSAAGE